MVERIDARVAEILTDREVVLNRGSDAGVIKGMRFAILNSRGARILDPETGEELGSVEVEKTIVKVTRVSPRLSVARTFRTVTTPGGPLYFGALNLSRAPVTRTETLRTQDAPYSDELDETESFVKVGDHAVQVVGDEYGASAGD